MEMIKKKLEGTIIHKLHTKYQRSKRRIKGEISARSLFWKKFFLKKSFEKKLGYELDFNKEPETFNQKIQFRKLFDKNPLYSLCSDKYKVREYVKGKIGDEYFVPLYLVTEKLTKQQWDKLPNQFVAKTTHTSGHVQIVMDKSSANYEKICKELDRQLKEKYGTLSMESYYNDIEPKIIIEKLLSRDPDDYKFHCFKQKDGSFKILLQITYDRSSALKKQNFDENFNLQTFIYERQPGDRKFEKPEGFEKMKELSYKLAEDFDYVRVDFYNQNGKIYFGELTFCPVSGRGKFSPVEWDYKWGSYWDLNLTR